MQAVPGLILLIVILFSLKDDYSPLRDDLGRQEPPVLLINDLSMVEWSFLKISASMKALL